MNKLAALFGIALGLAAGVAIAGMGSETPLYMSTFSAF